MQKENLKVILKPLIKQCIKECILEEGVLSGIITEVVKGMESQRVVTEGMTVRPAATPPGPDPEEIKRREEEYEKDRQERIRRLNETANIAGVNVFENLQNVPEEQHKSDTPGANPLAGVAPNDSGVDISGIMALSQGKWKDLV